VSEFEAKAMKDQLNNENTFLFSLDGTRLERDSAQAKTFDTERDNAINWIHFWHGDVRGYNRRKMIGLPRTWSGVNQANQGSIAIMKSAASAG